MRYMLDTNVCIDYLKGNSENIRDRIVSAPDGTLCISAITLSELMFGVENSSNREKNLVALNFFLLKIDIVPYDDQAASAYGEIRKQLRQEGNIIGGMDMLIAAHARSSDSILITHNTREFNRVRGLRIEDWY
jgi:tRNA(fMet)-specific endonuclease VapC